MQNQDIAASSQPSDSPGGAQHQSQQNPSLTTDDLCATVYQELRNIAAWHLSTSHHSITIEATELVHEAISRVLKQRTDKWNERSHLLAVASIMIRRVLINHIRDRSAAVRGGGATPSSIIVDLGGQSALSETQLLELNEALERLEQIADRQSKIVEMKYFGGLSTRDIATYLDVSERTVQLDWNHARLWLARELAHE